MTTSTRHIISLLMENESGAPDSFSINREII